MHIQLMQVWCVCVCIFSTRVSFNQTAEGRGGGIIAGMKLWARGAEEEYIYNNHLEHLLMGSFELHDDEWNDRFLVSPFFFGGEGGR